MKNESRIVFTFNEESLEQVNAIMESGHFTSIGEAVGESVATQYGLVMQAAEGFTEVIVRNPKTQQERVMRMPRPVLSRILETLKRASAS
jgi:hypothetical protein